jgi:hypothetical protein
MRCKACQYPLWNLRPGGCPECGRAFKPSDYAFKPNAVCFCCPHCEQTYYGTGEQGHLVPAVFDCVKCGKHIAMDEMLARPADGVREEDTGPTAAWHDRSRSGFTRFFGLAFAGLTRPRDAMVELPRGAGFLRPLAFVCAISALCAGLGLVIGLFIYAVDAVLWLGGGYTFEEYVVPVLLAGAIWPVYLVTVALVQHAVLAATGGTARGLVGTTESVCYTSGPALLLLIPLVGPFMLMVGAIWAATLQAGALAARQGVGVWRSIVAAALVPLGLVVATPFAAGWYLWEVHYALAYTSPSWGWGGGGYGPGGAWGMPPMNDSYELQAIQAGLSFYASGSGGAGPPHAIQLITQGHAGTWDFISNSTATVTSHVPLDTTTLASIDQGAAASVMAAEARVLSAMPADVIAHRLGDFVLTYHGIDVSGGGTAGAGQPGATALVAPPDANSLWVVFACPDPDVNPPAFGVHPGDWTEWSYITADGTIGSVTEANFTAELAAQNTLRTNAGLASLPDLRIVTHAAPVTEAAMNAGGYTP